MSTPKPSRPRIKRPVLVNAVHMAAQYPDTFARPDAAELASIGPGWLVKVAAGGERFWTVITEVRANGVLIARVDNALMFQPKGGPQMGDLIALSPDNAYEVMSPAELAALQERHRGQ